MGRNEKRRLECERGGRGREDGEEESQENEETGGNERDCRVNGS